MAINKIDSNLTGLYIAEEASLKTLPGSPVWYEREPNGFSDFGADFKTVARSPITIGRQKKKGTMVDMDATGGFSEDITANNVTRLSQGFFFADAHEKACTKPVNGSTSISLTAVTTTTFTAASGLTIFKAKDIVKLNGSSVATNNTALGVVTTSVTGTVTVGTATWTAEASPSANTYAETVGVEFASGDVGLTVTGSSPVTAITLTSVAYDFTTLGLSAGEWVFVGGDATANKFATCPVFYGRIATIAAHAITFSETTGTPVSDTGSGKTIRMFFGKFLRNEKTSALIKRRSYQLERQLGSDANGVQSEYIIGAVPNEMNIKIPEAEKISADFSFVGLDVEYRTGSTGVKAGTRVSSAGEEALNTTNNVYRMSISEVSTSLNPGNLLGYVSEANISLKNGVKGEKAIGVLGSFDTSTGDFDVSGSLTAFFTNTLAATAIRNSADISFNVVTAKDNQGLVFDLPLVSLSGGRADVSKDAPVKLGLSSMAAENAYGFTMGMTFFQYLPSVAMPV